MSISRMKHITIAAAKSAESDMLYKLSWLSCLEVLPYEQFTVEDAETLELPSNAEAISAAEEKLEMYASALALCKEYDRQKKKLFEPVDYLTKEQVESAQTEDGTLLRAAELSKQTTELRSRIAACDTEIAAYAPYVNYDAPLGLEATKFTQIILGSFADTDDAKAAVDALDEESGAYFCDIGEHAGRAYFAVFTPRSELDKTMSAITENGFIRNSFTASEKTAAVLLHEAENKKKQLEEELSDAEQEAVSFAAENQKSLKLGFDRANARLELEKLKAKLPSTSSCVIMEGWYPADDEKKLFSLLGKYPCYYEARDVKDEDGDVPVKLKNGKFAKHFEQVEAMYSLPHYRGVDASFVMSLFYVVTFALMFADVGYGLILALGGFLGPLIIKPKKGMKEFLHLFGICGIFCIISGICLNGYFGDLPTAIAQNWLGVKEYSWPHIIDPLASPMVLLIIGIALGFVQVMFGMGMAGYLQIKRGHILDALFDVGSWYLFLFGLVALGAGALVSGIPPIVATVGKWMAIAGAAALVLTQGRREKNIFMKLFKGITSLYSTVNILSDVLSYSRILALGLASTVIASVANLLATMNGFSFGGLIMFVLVFLFGHLLNFALNVLGTYVHTGRLQYIEFFGHFYEDGGRAFKPIEYSTKYNGIIYKEEL